MSEHFWAQTQGSCGPRCSQWPCALESTQLVPNPHVPPRLPRRSPGDRGPAALHGSPPALEPEAGWRPSPHGEVGQGSGKGVTARHPRWSVSQEGASGGRGGRMRAMEVGLEKQAPCSDLACRRPAPGSPRGAPPLRAVAGPQELLHGGAAEQSGRRPCFPGVTGARVHSQACEVLL